LSRIEEEDERELIEREPKGSEIDPEPPPDTIEEELTYGLGDVPARPKSANAVRELSRFTRTPRRSHWKALTRCLRYVASNMEQGIEFHPPEGEEELTMKFFVDASHGDETDGLSVS